MNVRICLIIIFNHRYDKNIEILDKIYEGRFEKIYHLVPFYVGSKENVIPVYESSFQFHGYVAQGLNKYFDEKYTHYLFIADDLILNPLINQNNIFEYFELKMDEAYLPEVKSWRELRCWNFENIIFSCVRSFETGAGTNYKSEILGRAEAFERVKKFGYKEDEFNLKYVDMFNKFMTIKGAIKFVLNYPKYFMALRKGISAPYPMFGGYSDIFLMPEKDIKETVRVFGVFAALGLWVELAIPTAMRLFCEKLKTKKDYSKIIWDEEEKKNLELAYDCDLKKLFLNWPINCNYIHPVKLSRWKM